MPIQLPQIQVGATPQAPDYSVLSQPIVKGIEKLLEKRKKKGVADALTQVQQAYLENHFKLIDPRQREGALASYTNAVGKIDMPDDADGQAEVQRRIELLRTQLTTTGQEYTLKEGLDNEKLGYAVKRDSDVRAAIATGNPNYIQALSNELLEDANNPELFVESRRIAKETRHRLETEVIPKARELYAQRAATIAYENNDFIEEQDDGTFQITPYGEKLITDLFHESVGGVERWKELYDANHQLMEDREQEFRRNFAIGVIQNEVEGLSVPPDGVLAPGDTPKKWFHRNKADIEKKIAALKLKDGTPKELDEYLTAIQNKLANADVSAVDAKYRALTLESGITPDRFNHLFVLYMEEANVKAPEARAKIMGFMKDRMADGVVRVMLKNPNMKYEDVSAQIKGNHPAFNVLNKGQKDDLERAMLAAYKTARGVDEESKLADLKADTRRRLKDAYDGGGLDIFDIRLATTQLAEEAGIGEERANEFVLDAAKSLLIDRVAALRFGGDGVETFDKVWERIIEENPFLVDFLSQADVDDMRAAVARGHIGFLGIDAAVVRASLDQVADNQKNLTAYRDNPTAQTLGSIRPLPPFQGKDSQSAIALGKYIAAESVDKDIPLEVWSNIELYKHYDDPVWMRNLVYETALKHQPALLHNRQRFGTAISLSPNYLQFGPDNEIQISKQVIPLEDREQVLVSILKGGVRMSDLSIEDQTKIHTACSTNPGSNCQTLRNYSPLVDVNYVRSKYLGGDNEIDLEDWRYLDDNNYDLRVLLTHALKHVTFVSSPEDFGSPYDMQKAWWGNILNPLLKEYQKRRKAFPDESEEDSAKKVAEKATIGLPGRHQGRSWRQIVDEWDGDTGTIQGDSVVIDDERDTSLTLLDITPTQFFPQFEVDRLIREGDAFIDDGNVARWNRARFGESMNRWLNEGTLKFSFGYRKGSNGEPVIAIFPYTEDSQGVKRKPFGNKALIIKPKPVR